MERDDRDLRAVAEQAAAVIDACFPPARRLRRLRAALGWPLVVLGGAVFALGYWIKGGRPIRS